MKTITFNIPDLHCAGCADRSVTILERIDGVHKVDITFEAKSANVEYDPNKATFEEMKEGLAKAGYTAER